MKTEGVFKSRTDFESPKPKVVVHDGLAMYQVGAGRPVLLMAYPHGYTLEPAAEGQLAALLVGLGFQVLSFDPPGAFRSARPARIDMPEMLESACQTLQEFCGPEPVDVVGHSMGGLCSLAFALEHPGRVRRLVLVGSLAGGPSVQRHRGLPYYWKLTDRNFWRFIIWGLQVGNGWGNLAIHKRLVQLIRQASVYQSKGVVSIPMEPGDETRPAPVRDRWPMYARRIDYQPSLSRITAPTLVCAGRHDPQAPLGCSQELVDGLPNARLVLFERSGHYPFLEEKELFERELAAFLN